MKQIKISIPEKRDLQRWRDIVWFKISGGFSCDCGTKSQFSHAKFESSIYNKRFMFMNNTKNVCPACTQKEFNKKATLVFDESNCKCDWCDETKSTMSMPRPKHVKSVVHFGSNWWNGHHICQDCFNLAIEGRGPIHSSRTKYIDKVEYNLNELGLWIKMK